MQKNKFRFQGKIMVSKEISDKNDIDGFNLKNIFNPKDDF